MPHPKDHPNNAFKQSTRFVQYERAKMARAGILKARERIPRVLGPNTYIYATIAANGGILHQTDILVSLSPSAARIDKCDAKFAGMLRTFRAYGAGSKGPRDHVR